MTNPVDELRRNYRVETDSALALRMGVSRSAVAKWRERKAVPLSRQTVAVPCPAPPGRPMMFVENVVWTDLRRAFALLEAAHDLAVRHDLPEIHILRARQAVQDALWREEQLHPLDLGELT